MSAWVGRLVAVLIEDDESGLWELVEPLGFSSEVAGMTFVAPPGFRTDFCSVPRVPLAYELLGNRARKAGVVHDWLYTTHVVPRAVADKVLREMVRADGVDAIEAEEFYLAVRLAGGSHWGPDPAAARDSA